MANKNKKKFTKKMLEKRSEVAEAIKKSGGAKNPFAVASAVVKKKKKK